MTPTIHSLDDREEAVALALGSGRTVEQVAHDMGLRPRQVRRIVEVARGKVGAPNIPALVRHVTERDTLRKAGLG